jgi:hypothetical protein
VSEILSVDNGTAQQEPPRRARPERPIYPPADRAAVEESGTVKWYNAEAHAFYRSIGYEPKFIPLS